MNIPEAMDRYLAKSTPPESIREHTCNLMLEAETLWRFFGNYFDETEREIIELAILYHDLGKANYAFQEKLLSVLRLPEQDEPETRDFYKGQKGVCEVPHGYLSPSFMPLDELLVKYGREWVSALVNAVYYHHTRDQLPNAVVIDVLENDLKKRLGGAFRFNRDYLCCVKKMENSMPFEDWCRYTLVKGILNRLDYSASAGDGLPVEIDALQDGRHLGQIIEESILSRWELRDVQKYMKEARDKNPVVIASTGIGKTEAALLWAGGSKCFYTLPLKISINAIYNRIVSRGNDGEAGGYGYSPERCTLLHSDALSYLIREENEGDPVTKYERAKLFSYPVTVCTVDQLFTFVYRYLGCEMIPATLKYSKVIVDEVQAYSPEILARIIFGLKVINELGGKFAIVTATFPPIFEHFLKKQRIPYEKPQPFYSPITKRHLLSYQEVDFDYARIIKEAENKKVLVLCNTVRRACEVFKRLSDSGCSQIHLLHSRFQKRHREMLEKAIIDFSSGTAAGIWVSTQIVEASLDIDFDLLFTEMCPADSLLQRLGRCWRKREYNKETPNVFICDIKTGLGRVYPEKLVYENSVKFLKNYCGRIFSEQDKQDYINTVYSVEMLRDTEYFETVNRELDRLSSLPFAGITKAQAISKFRSITGETVVPDAVYNELLSTGELQKLLSVLKDSKADRRERQFARDKLYSYTISVDPTFLRVKPDRTDIDPYLPVKRIGAKYEFDESQFVGRGLLDEPCEVTL